jgi:hypothetical protein
MPVAMNDRGVSARNKAGDGQSPQSRRQGAAAKAYKDQQALLKQQQEQPEQQPAPSDPYDGEDVKKRVQQWFILMRQMQANPDSPEFVYLRHARPTALPFNPFDLQVSLQPVCSSQLVRANTIQVQLTCWCGYRNMRLALYYSKKWMTGLRTTHALRILEYTALQQSMQQHIQIESPVTS